MAASAPCGTGLELAKRSDAAQVVQTLLPSGSATCPRTAKRTTLADMNKDLQSLTKQYPPQRRRIILALGDYTAVRVTANIYAVGHPDVAINENPFHHVCDAVLRPLVAGLGVFIFVHREDRFSTKNQLHIWSRFTACCLALPLRDQSLELVMSRFSPWRLRAMIGWEFCCNMLQVYMTALKMQALGWQLTATFCKLLASLAAGFLAIVGIWSLYKNWNESVAPFFQYFLLALLASLSLQVWVLCCAASRALTRARGDVTIKWKACILYVNSVLVILGPGLSWRGVFAIYLRSPNSIRTWVTLDVAFQVCNVVLLSGLVGPVQWGLKSLERLAKLSGYGLACKRIAFPGHISANALDCIVSFPGKYSELWDRAVSTSTAQDSFSLACVFLTDAASGLGQHAENPETPGKCWCHQICGPMPASTYLSIVEMEDCSPEALAFKKEDAKAMGQRLLIRDDQHDLDWEAEVAAAPEEAEALCRDNQYRPPWGCKWFEDWKRNLDTAVGQQQTLHVFYFEDCKGKGKLTWELLSSEEARDGVRKTSGLGASQTSEVAYLDKLGLKYVEHDIKEFQPFLTMAGL